MNIKNNKPNSKKNELLQNFTKLLSICFEISNNLNENVEFDSLMEFEIKKYVERELVIQSMMEKFPEMTYQMVLKMWEDMKKNRINNLQD